MPSVTSIAQIFSLIESNKEELKIETYLLSQTTLEQIFISFARKQIDRTKNLTYIPNDDDIKSNNSYSVGQTVLDMDNISHSYSKPQHQVYLNNSYVEETNIALKEF